ncbi:glycoside hydrolase family 15 protein [Yinghuangia sp. YIM S09857]|uniref:glycoside hydrolase family 15 protein n=1 Tax=Yinghuangia sp. YIM S09857 TaxID=3436929 RepID=UPI003F53870D
MRRRSRWLAIGVALVVLGAGIAIARADDSKGRHHVPPLYLGGVAADAGAPGGLVALPADAPPRAHTREERAWLASGMVPGTDPAFRDMAERALLDMRLLTRPDGAVAAAWYSIWQYMWPRDTAWVVAALCATGHSADALNILRRLVALQEADGSWEARYRLDGTHVGDGRRAQLDGNGWVPWAVWYWYSSQEPGDAAADAALAELWPSVRKAADRAATSLRRNGLPPPGPDYWESRNDQVTLGTAAPLLAGLRAAADLARRIGDAEGAARWSGSSQTLAEAVTDEFGAHGYRRTARSVSGADTAVTWLGPPFAAPDPAVAAAVRTSAAELTLANGGILPGGDWRGHREVAWTPETAAFALYDAASGNRPQAVARLHWLAQHRTAFGSLPEKVDAAGRPVSVAPLAWTSAIVVLAIVALDHPLPIPPP